MGMNASPKHEQSPLPAPETDEELVDHVLAGDKDQYARLMRRHNQRLFRAVRAILRQDDQAEDVVQEAYVIAYQNLAGFRRESAFATWLTRIAVNEALGRLRKRARAQHLGLVEEANADATMGTPPHTPEDQAARAELRRLLEDQIDALPEAYRTVLVLRDVQELDTAETAASLGLTEEAVRVRLHRARQALQASLAEAVGSHVGEAFRFGGARCDRIVAAVLARIS